MENLYFTNLDTAEKEETDIFYNNKNKRKKAVKQVFKKLGTIIINIYMAVSVIFGLYIGFSHLYPEKEYELVCAIDNTINQINKTQDHNWSVENNVDTLYNIQPEIWDTLTYEQKVDTIENLMNMELYNLGVTSPVKLIVKNISGNTLGKHHQNLNIIEIDTYHLINDSVYDVVNTVCHECRHAYQYNCVIAYENTNSNYKNLEMYDNAEQFKENLANYIELKWNDEDSYDQYASQIVESDASQYAAVQTDNYYYNLIPKYIESE